MAGSRGTRQVRGRTHINTRKRVGGWGCPSSASGGMPLSPVCLVYDTSLIADHWCKAAAEAVAMRYPFAFVDVLACLAQDDCDEMLVTRPDSSTM